MSEQEVSHEELEAFREEIRDAIYSNIFILTSGQDEGPFNVDPMSLGLGEENIAQLLPEKVAIIKEELYRMIGIEEEKQIITAYNASDEETLEISVIEGLGANEEGEPVPFYLHEIKHQSGDLDWQLSNSPDPLL